jgi:large subunit ribosomal protein L18
MSKEKNASKMRIVRHDRLRKKVTGSTERPRLSVFRSSKNIYAQVIDDVNGKTIVSSSSAESSLTGATKTETAEKVGANIAQKCKDQGITTIVFDRGGYKYHGRVKALAESARTNGLEF